MSEKLKSCHCGNEDEIEGKYNGLFYEVICPNCARRVSAFTAKGLVDSWNEESDQPDEGLMCQQTM